jgi:large subunit ribosomal protein L29
MKTDELRGLNEAQLGEQLTDLHSEWQTLRFQEAIGTLTATARVRQIRKEIARIHTIRTEREMDAALRASLTASGRQ